MKTLLATTAIALLATIGTANASPAALLGGTTTTTVNQAMTAYQLNKQQQAAIAGAGAFAGGGKGGSGTGTGGDSQGSVDNTTNNKTDVDNLGLAFSFPPPALGNEAWGSYQILYGAFSSTYFEEDIVNSNVFSNVLGGFVQTEDPAKTATLKSILAAYMCASGNDDIRMGGGQLYGTMGLTGCLTKD